MILKRTLIGLGSTILLFTGLYAFAEDKAPSPQEEALKAKAIPTSEVSNTQLNFKKSELEDSGVYALGGTLLVDRNLQVVSIVVSTLTPTNIIGVTDGSTPPTGDIGEQITAYGTSSVSSTNKVGIATATLTAGYWSVSASYNSDNVITQTGFNAYLYVKGTNTATLGDDLMFIRTAAGEAGSITFTTRLIIVSSADSSKTIAVYGQSVTATGTAYVKIIAIRIK